MRIKIKYLSHYTENYKEKTLVLVAFNQQTSDAIKGQGTVTV